MLKYLLVIFLPSFSQYGYLVILSVTFVTIANILFFIFIFHSACKKPYKEVPQSDTQAKDADVVINADS